MSRCSLRCALFAREHSVCSPYLVRLRSHSWCFLQFCFQGMQSRMRPFLTWQQLTFNKCAHLRIVALRALILIRFQPMVFAFLEQVDGGLVSKQSSRSFQEFCKGTPGTSPLGRLTAQTLDFAAQTQDALLML